MNYLDEMLLLERLIPIIKTEVNIFKNDKFFDSTLKIKNDMKIDFNVKIEMADAQIEPLKDGNYNITFVTFLTLEIYPPFGDKHGKYEIVVDSLSNIIINPTTNKLIYISDIINDFKNEFYDRTPELQKLEQEFFEDIYANNFTKQYQSGKYEFDIDKISDLFLNDIIFKVHKTIKNELLISNKNINKIVKKYIDDFKTNNRSFNHPQEQQIKYNLIEKYLESIINKKFEFKSIIETVNSVDLSNLSSNINNFSMNYWKSSQLKTKLLKINKKLDFNKFIILMNDLYKSDINKLINSIRISDSDNKSVSESILELKTKKEIILEIFNDLKNTKLDTFEMTIEKEIENYINNIYKEYIIKNPYNITYKLKVNSEYKFTYKNYRDIISQYITNELLSKYIEIYNEHENFGINTSIYEL